MKMDSKRYARLVARKTRLILGFGVRDDYPGIPDGASVLIHVGKSGGTSLRTALKETELGAHMHVVHIRKPPIRSNLSYYIVARGPISRAISAFNWRH